MSGDEFRSKQYPWDLVEFLKERIREDEWIAQFVAGDSPTDDVEFCMWATSFDRVDPNQLIVAVDYQRVLVEVEVKLRIVAAFNEVWDHDSPNYAAVADYMETVIRELASVYRDHPDYDAMWNEEP